MIDRDKLKEIKQEAKNYLDNFDGNKKAFLENLIEALGNKTHAAAVTGISRQTYCNWINESPEYAKAVEAAAQAGRQYRGDLYERTLDEKVLVDKDTTALIFGLKTQFKDRGYNERREITGADGKPIEVTQVDKAILEMIEGDDPDAPALEG